MSQHFVYRLHGESGLLYVGCTTDPDRRLRAHRQKDWWSKVTDVEVLPFDSRQEAFAHEAELIGAEQPEHNRMIPSGNAPAPRESKALNVPVSLRVSRDDLAAIREIARAEQRTPSQQIRHWVQCGIDREEQAA